MRTFARLCESRDNNFNLIRIIAAGSVLISHAFALTARPEPLAEDVTMSLGSVAVLVFFALSGFLITKSMSERRSAVEFIVARALRIAPALFVALLATVLVLGPIFTTLEQGEYWTTPSTYGYAVWNGSLLQTRAGLPGVFAHNPYPIVVNGSLWTLPIEVRCYAAVFLCGVAGLLRPRSFPIPLLAVLALTLPAYWGGADDTDVAITDSAMAGLALPYVLGAAAYVYRRHIPYSGWLALALTVLAAATRETAVFRAVFALALSYGALWLGGVRSGALLYNRLGDFSYGTYIFAYPIQQMLVARNPQIGVGEMIAWSLPVTVALAALSWWAIERPSLMLRKRATAWFTRPKAAA